MGDTYLGIIVEEHVGNLHFNAGVVNGRGHAPNSQHTILYRTWGHRGQVVGVPANTEAEDVHQICSTAWRQCAEEGQ